MLIILLPRLALLQRYVPRPCQETIRLPGHPKYIVLHLDCLSPGRTSPMYLHEQRWVVGNTGCGRTARGDNSELILNRHAIVLDQAVLYCLVVNIAEV